jgi:hypothetical protein
LGAHDLADSAPFNAQHVTVQEYEGVEGAGDIDLWVRCSEQNAQRVIAALTRFGAPLMNITAADFTTPDIVFQIGVAPGGHLDGHRWRGVRGGMRVPVLGCAHLIRNKRAAGRPKDLADASWLEAAGSD